MFLSIFPLPERTQPSGQSRYGPTPFFCVYGSPRGSLLHISLSVHHPCVSRTGGGAAAAVRSTESAGKRTRSPLQQAWSYHPPCVVPRDERGVALFLL